jgi:drug/metabolite transporter (DMT)-like permease
VWYRRVMPGVARKDSQVMGVLYVGGFVAAAALAGVRFQAASLHLTMPQILVLIYLGVVASGVGFFMWNVGARRTNVGALAIFNNAKVPLGILASALVFGDAVRWHNVLAGGAIIVASLVLNQRLCRRTRA